MRKTCKTTKRSLATAVMAALLSCGVMGTGFAAAVVGISYDGGTLTPGSDGTIAVSAIMTAGGISSYLLKSDFTEFKEVTGTELAELSKDMILLGADMIHESDFKEYKSETAATLGTMQTTVSSLSDLTAGFPEGKTIKNYVDDSITVVTGEISGLDGRVSAAENGLVNAVNDISNLDTRVTQNETDLSALEGRVTANEGNIATNKTNIKKLNNALYGDTLALGKGSKATGTHSIAIGFGNKVKGSRSGAFGDPTIVDGDDSYSVGNNNEVTGNSTFVLGNNVKTSAKNAVVLGDGSEGVDDAVSVGSKEKKRQIKNVADGTEDSDAATYGQLKALAGGAGAGLEEVTRRISDVDSKVNKVGAGAAALSALHPMDTDSKFGIAAGFGNYRDANAMALGMFYRPTDRVMLSIGGTMGNGENMLNAGVSFALDKGVTTSKAAMARTIKAQGEKIAVQDTKIQVLEGENAEHKAEIQALKEALARLEAKIGK